MKYENEHLNQLEQSFDWSKDVHGGYLTKEGKYKDRVIRHDLMHQLIADDARPRPLRLRVGDEWANAIIQAVLEGTAKVSPNACSITNGRTAPKLEPINKQILSEVTLPQALQFFEKLLKEKIGPLPEKFYKPVSSKFIENHLKIGRSFKQNFKNQYGEEYISMDIEHLLAIPKSELRELYKSAKVEAQKPNTFER